jgi:hypothetical protein
VGQTLTKIPPPPLLAELPAMVESVRFITSADDGNADDEEKPLP